MATESTENLRECSNCGNPVELLFQRDECKTCIVNGFRKHRSYYDAARAGKIPRLHYGNGDEIKLTQLSYQR